jgi:hypothetical protein
MKRRAIHSYGTRRNVSRKVWGAPGNTVMLDFGKLDALADFVKVFENNPIPDRSDLEMHMVSIQNNDDHRSDEEGFGIQRRRKVIPVLNKKVIVFSIHI